MSDIKQKAREMFDEKFPIIQTIGIDEASGTFAVESDKQEVANFIDQMIDLAIAERDKEIINAILRKRSCRSHEPENCNVCAGRQEALDIINLITKTK